MDTENPGSEFAKDLVHHDELVSKDVHPSSGLSSEQANAVVRAAKREALLAQRSMALELGAASRRIIAMRRLKIGRAHV